MSPVHIDQASAVSIRTHSLVDACTNGEWQYREGGGHGSARCRKEQPRQDSTDAKRPLSKPIEYKPRGNKRKRSPNANSRRP